MQANEKELLRKAQENAHWMFSEEEIAILCNVPQVIVGRVAEASDSPFFLKKCRPEWFVEWMRRHADFESSESIKAKFVPKKVSEGSSHSNPWAEARRPGEGRRER